MDVSKTAEISEPLLFNLDVFHSDFRNPELSAPRKHFWIPYILSTALCQSGSKLCQAVKDRNDPVSRDVAHHGVLFFFLNYYIVLKIVIRILNTKIYPLKFLSV